MNKLLTNVAGILLFCLITLLFSMKAEASTWQVVTENTGLGGRSANCVAAFGKFLAVGTDEGVSIYDGDSCTWQPLPLPEEIASISVVDIAADESGSLWLATNKGLINVQGKRTYVYGSESNLPTLDINRIQIQENRIYAGCFGGYIVSAFIPQGGMAKFSPVNYQTDPDSDTLKIRSVGVSAMAMQSNFQGWISTMGNGLIEVSGSNEFTVTNCANQPESWINDFYIFHEGKIREKRFLAVTPEYLSLIKNGQAQREIRLPKPDQWLNCVVTVKENPDFFDWVPLPEMQGDEEFLADFIGRRAVWVGTRSSGLWRFYKGTWRQYLAENSVLPSNCINRLYVYKKLLLVCTDAGLVIVHLAPDRFDELQETGVGTRYNKTYFPFKADMVYFQVVKNSSYWISHQYGLTRWKTDDKNVSRHMQQRDRSFENLSARVEPVPEFEKTEEADESAGAETPENAEELAKAFSEEEQQEQELAAGRYWEHYTNHPEYATATNAFKIPYQEITSMAADTSTDYLWLIFAGRHLARMRMVRRIEKVDGRNVTVERADWQMLQKFVPWTDGERLNVVWFSGGKVYIGSSQGFYILENPESEDMKGDPFRWQHYGVFQGLSIPEVRGFAWWHAQKGKVLAIMHNQGISTWDGRHFVRIETGGDNTCIKSGSDGNLWIGTVSGLRRIDPTGEMYMYTTINANFNSDIITAIGVVPGENDSVAVWVACDGFARYNENGQTLEGADKMPHLVTRKDGTTVTYDNYSPIDLRFLTSSWHYYDGLTWEKWRVPGIRDLFIDRNYIWAPTNVRVRRMRINHSDY